MDSYPFQDDIDEAVCEFLSIKQFNSGFIALFNRQSIDASFIIFK